MTTSKIDYAAVYADIKSGMPNKEIASKYGCTTGTIMNCKLFGDSLLKKVTTVPLKKTLADFTARELVEELKSRGVTGRIIIPFEIDIQKFV